MENTNKQNIVGELMMLCVRGNRQDAANTLALLNNEEVREIARAANVLCRLAQASTDRREGAAFPRTETAV